MATMVSVTVVLVVAPSGDTKWWQRDGGVSGCDNIGGYCSIDDGDGNGDNDDGGDGDGGNNGGGSNVGGDGDVGENGGGGSNTCGCGGGS